jgi:hypothetical protein
MSSNEPNPLQAEIDRLGQMQDKIQLKEVSETLAEIERGANELTTKLASVRANGYVYKSYLEANIAALTMKWRDLSTRLQSELLHQQSTLQSEYTDIQRMHMLGALAGPALDMLENHADTARHSLEEECDPPRDEVNQTSKQLDDVAWTLAQAGEASFHFASGEAPIETVSAEWKKPGSKDGLNGVLFLTDQRLIFEQKEEVATKKVLFVATAKQKLQSVQWEVPVAQIQSAVGSKKGFLGKDDYLTFTCSSATPFRTAEIHLKGETGEAWHGFIDHVNSGAIAQERITGPAFKVS